MSILLGRGKVIKWLITETLILIAALIVGFAIGGGSPSEGGSSAWAFVAGFFIFFNIVALIFFRGTREERLPPYVPPGWDA